MPYKAHGKLKEQNGQCGERYSSWGPCRQHGPHSTGSSSLVPVEYCHVGNIGPVLLNLLIFLRGPRNLDLFLKKSNLKNVAITILKNTV